MIYHSNHNRVGFEKPARGTRIPAPSSFSTLASWKREIDFRRGDTVFNGENFRALQGKHSLTRASSAATMKPLILSHTSYPLRVNLAHILIKRIELNVAVLPSRCFLGFFDAALLRRLTKMLFKFAM